MYLFRCVFISVNNCVKKLFEATDSELLSKNISFFFKVNEKNTQKTATL